MPNAIDVVSKQVRDAVFAVVHAARQVDRAGGLVGEIEAVEKLLDLISGTSFDTYQRDVCRTLPITPDTKHMLPIGLAGEVGEVCDLIKKYRYHRGEEVPKDLLQDEVGDTLFYLVALCETNGFSIADAAKANMLKRQRRYPDGFTKAASIERADKL